MGDLNGNGPAMFWGNVPWGTGNPEATPLFSVPDDITLVNPSWQTCSTISYGIWDPPIKLTKETAMVPAASTLSQQLIATPRSPISTPYGPATIMPSYGPATVLPSVEDPKTDAPRLMPPIPPGNTDPNAPIGDPPFSNSDPSLSSSDPTNNALPSEDPVNESSALDAPSATLPSTRIDRPAQRIEDAASSSIATSVVNIQNPAPGPSPGPRLSVQSDIEDTGFALSLVTPIAMSRSNTVGGQIMSANPEPISLPTTILNPSQSGIDIAGTPVELDISSQLVIGAPQIGSTTIPLSAVSSGIFTIGGQVFTAKSNAIFMEGERIAPGGQGQTIGGTRVSLGSSGLLDVGSRTIFLSAEPILPTVFTVGSEVFTPNPTAISMDGTTITAGGPGVTIAGTPVDLQASGSLIIGNSTFAVIPTNLYTSPTNLILEGQAPDRGRNMFFCGVSIVTICTALAAL